MLICLSRRVLGLNSIYRVKRWWLCFYVNVNLLDHVWISDPKAAHADDTQGTAQKRLVVGNGQENVVNSSLTQSEEGR